MFMYALLILSMLIWSIYVYDYSSWSAHVCTCCPVVSYATLIHTRHYAHAPPSNQPHSTLVSASLMVWMHVVYFNLFLLPELLSIYTVYGLTILSPFTPPAYNHIYIRADVLCLQDVFTSDLHHCHNFLCPHACFIILTGSYKYHVWAKKKLSHACMWC